MADELITRRDRDRAIELVKPMIQVLERHVESYSFDSQFAEEDMQDMLDSLKEWCYSEGVDHD